MNEVAINIRFSCGHKFSTPLSKYQGVKFLDCMIKVKVFIAQLYPTLCDAMDCSPSGFTVHGILQARILEWTAISFSRGSSQSRDWTCVSYIGRWILYLWTTKKAQYTPCSLLKHIPVYLIRHLVEVPKIHEAFCFSQEVPDSYHSISWPSGERTTHSRMSFPPNPSNFLPQTLTLHLHPWPPWHSFPLVMHNTAF